jgi:hypothetical protein
MYFSRLEVNENIYSCYAGKAIQRYIYLGVEFRYSLPKSSKSVKQKLNTILLGKDIAIIQ